MACGHSDARRGAGDGLLPTVDTQGSVRQGKRPGNSRCCYIVVSCMHVHIHALYVYLSRCLTLSCTPHDNIEYLRMYVCKCVRVRMYVYNLVLYAHTRLDHARMRCVSGINLASSALFQGIGLDKFSFQGVDELRTIGPWSNTAPALRVDMSLAGDEACRCFGIPSCMHT